MLTTKKKLVFYVDTECSFSTKNRCSYYSSRGVQEQAGKSSKDTWGNKCCPIVYVKSGSKKYKAFCPTRGGPWGEQLPTSRSMPGPSALRIEVTPHSNEKWEEVLERAARTACQSKCQDYAK